MYAIFGCGTVGHTIAEILQARDRRVLVVDRSADRLAALQDKGFETVIGDITDPEKFRDRLAGIDTFLILTAKDETNLAALEAVKGLFPDALTLVRASNQGTAEEMGAAGADCIADSSTVLSRAVIRDLQELEIQKKTDSLVRIIQEAGEKGLTIFTHNSPDPDCIASALALQRIADHCGVPSRVYYQGRIGHQQNRTLVNILGIQMNRLDGGADEVQHIIDDSGKVAVVDTELAGRNNPLPKDYAPDIVIGHHETNGKIPGEHVDVRADIGAVSTILWTYLMELSITPDTKLATALLHAIRIDTKGLTRKTSKMDLKAVQNLAELADRNLLEDIENPPMSPETLDVLAGAISNRVVRGPYLATSVGFITDRDALPQAAELLLHLEGIATVVAYGVVEKNIHVSARTSDARVNLAQVLQAAFGEQFGGGHAQAAAAQIPLGILGEVDDRVELLELVENVVTKQFFNAVGATEERERRKEREKEKEKENGKEREGAAVDEAEAAAMQERAVRGARAGA